MKKAIAVVLAAVALAAVGGTFPAGREEPVDEAKVNARIDARLHQVLGQLLAEQRASARR